MALFTPKGRKCCALLLPALLGRLYRGKGLWGREEDTRRGDFRFKISDFKLKISEHRFEHLMTEGMGFSSSTIYLREMYGRS